MKKNEEKKIKEDKVKENKRKKVGKKIELGKIKSGIIDFTKLLYACVTYKMILLVVAVVICVFIFSDYKESVQKKINNSAEENITYMVDESLEKIRLKINDEFTVLKTLAVIYNDTEPETISEIETFYSEILAGHNFEGIKLLNTDKEEIISLGTNVSFEAEEFYEDILAGNQKISQAIFDEENNEEYIYLGVPVYEADKIVGILSCNYKIEEITKILDASSFEKFGTTFISQEDGILVARPESVGKNTNLFVLLDSININNVDSIKKLKKSIANGQSGIITYGEGKHKRYICYDVVPDTGWYAVSIVSANEIVPLESSVSKLALNLSVNIAFVFVFYIVLTLGIDIKLLKKKRNQEMLEEVTGESDEIIDESEELDED